jgi:NAD(P)H-hydrate epimerase
MTLALPEDSSGMVTPQAASQLIATRWDAVAIGPGLGRSDGVDAFVHRLIEEYPGPMVIDADALFSLARWPRLQSRQLSRAILTPHGGEFQRLMGRPPQTPIGDRLQEVRTLQEQTSAVIVLKGADSIIAAAEHYRINTTGNPGMGTGGTGDVLTGVIVGLLGQGWSTYDAGCLGSHLHGLAGDIAAQEKGEISLIARDLLDTLPKAFIQYGRSGTNREG